MNTKVFYILLEDVVLLSKKKYNNWREIQNEYYEKFKANLGPWTFNEIIHYFESDYGNENNWPFSKESIINFFQNDEITLFSVV
jgi:hypothetical protein